MKKEEFEPLIQYVKDWQKTEFVKPQNEQLFIDGFITLIKNYPDDREIEFNGEGAYFGKQVTLSPFSYYGYTSCDELMFEVAYCEDKISIYTAHHYGFWSPEFLRMDKTDNRFSELKTELFKFLSNCFGLT